MSYKWKAFIVVSLSLFVMVMDASALDVIQLILNERI